MGVRVVSGRRVVVDPADRAAPVVEHGGVRVEGGVVVAVGPAADLDGPGVEHLAFPGATVLPGLVNAHVHLAFDVTGDPVPALRDGDGDRLRATIAANAGAQLTAGITTVRDLGDRDGLVAELRDEIAAGRATGPRVLSALAPVTPRGGHCWFLGGEVDATPAAVRDAVRARADAGADVIKVMASGGNLTPSGPAMWESQFAAPELDALVSAAHDAGLPVAAHAHGTAAIALVARAGADTVEHASFRAEGGLHDQSEEVLMLLARRGAAVVPTRFRDWARWPPDAGLAAQIDRQRRLDAHGVPTLVGNDAGVGQGYFDDLQDAMTFYVAAGWSPLEVLAATTSRSADALGLGGRVGRLTPGHDADMLVVDGDPVEDLGALREVRAVFARGRTATGGT